MALRMRSGVSRPIPGKRFVRTGAGPGSTRSRSTWKSSWRASPARWGGGAPTPVAKAIRYMLSHWSGLCVFLTDGRVELDTNTIERLHRIVATTRKNALFAGADSGYIPEFCDFLR
jgi:hypothetical protein